MKFFYADEKLSEITEGNRVKSKAYIGVLGEEELSSFNSLSLPHSKVLSHIISQPAVSRVQVFTDCILGTLLLPIKKDRITGKLKISYYLNREVFFLIGDNKEIMHILGKVHSGAVGRSLSTSELFCQFLNVAIDEDVFYLEKIENALSRLEEEALDSIISDFQKRLAPNRTELRTLHSYYGQLLNLCAELRSSISDFVSEEDAIRFGYIKDRVEYLNSRVEELSEYAMQVRDIHQAHLDLRQTKSMNLLTVISAIFLPLTLIAGWYGMNFVNMPELKWFFGYPGVFIISAVIVIAEIWIFKKKGIF